MKHSSINSYQVETDFGSKSIEIHNGDITSFYKPFDIMVLSARSGRYFPVEGTIIEALSKINIDFYKLSKYPAIDLRKELNIWLTSNLENVNFKRIICVEFDKKQNIDESMKSLIPFFALLEKLNIDISTIAMPLLGTGCLKLPVEEMLKLQLKQCEEVLENIESVNKIYLVEKDKVKASKLDCALNNYLDRSEVQIKDIFEDDYNTEVLEKLDNNINKLLKIKKSSKNNINYDVLEDFKEQMDRKSLRYFELCTSARKFVEVLLQEDLHDYNKGKRLVDSINAYLSEGKVSTWISSYMHVIRVLTNHQIHYSATDRIPNEVKNLDQRILLACLCQITDYWIEISQ